MYLYKSLSQSNLSLQQSTAHHPMPQFKIRLIPLLLGLMLLAGCATPPLLKPDGSQTQSSSPPVTKTEHSPAPVPSRPKPDAIYQLESENRPLPPQVNESLQNIAAQVKANKNLVIRLESFVPSGGSREMNVSRSSSAVNRIRNRLAELGVPSYRIQQAPLGEEHPDAQKLDTKWVELFLVHLPR